MQSFKRGMPLLPAFANEQPDTEIDAGEQYGLKRWVRYEPVAWLIRGTPFGTASISFDHDELVIW